MMNVELIKAMSELTSRLQSIDGEVYRAKGSNIIKLFTQEYSLDTATTKEKPLDTIIFDFRSIVITDGTDNDTYLYVIFDRANGGKQFLKMKNNSSYSFDFQVTECTIFSGAQAGKKITVVLSKDGVFTTGALINSGTVNISVPTARVLTNPALTALTAVQVLAPNTLRKKATLQNNTGASQFLGPLGVTDSGATRGFELVNGATIEDINTAALYVYSVAGSAVGTFTVIEET